MGYTTRLWLREKPLRKDGMAPIYLRVTIDRESRRYHTNKFVAPEDWAGSEVKGKHPLSTALNTNLNEFRNKANKVFIDLENDGKDINFDSFENKFLSVKPQSFYDFALDEINRNKERYSKTFHYHFLCEISKLRKFAPTLFFSQINLDFIQRYEQYMRAELHNGSNTVARTMKRFKYLVTQAINKDYMKEDPFRKYSVAKEPTHREFLTMKEVQQLEKLSNKALTDGMKNTLQAFLFCCYTGLRYQDVCNLTFADIRDKKLHIQMHKTKDQVVIPLTDKARQLIPKPATKGKVFTVYTNQKCNQHLKALGPIAGVDKILTFHVARHTFATLSLDLGIPMEVVQKLLGHTDIRVTQIYAKVIDKRRDKEMEKWDRVPMPEKEKKR